MFKGTRVLVLPLLLAVGCSLFAGSAEAAHRREPRLAPTSWFSLWLALKLPFQTGRYGTQVDPDGRANIHKASTMVDPDSQGCPSGYGVMVDPDGRACPTR